MIFPCFQDLTLFFCQGQQATEVKVMVTPEEATYHGWETYQHPKDGWCFDFERFFWMGGEAIIGSQ